MKITMLRPLLAPAKPKGFAAVDRGTRQARGYGSEWDRLVRQIRSRDADLCQVCSRFGDVTLYSAIDHIVPKSRGGTDHPTNLQVICREHHAAKTAAESRGAEWLPKPIRRPSAPPGAV